MRSLPSLRNIVLVGSALVITAVNLIASLEGKSNTAYLDVVKVPTICYGYTYKVKMTDVKSDAECKELLLQEVKRIDALVSKLVKVKLEQHERAAIISFIYNVGDNAFKQSTLLKKLNAGDTKAACNELSKWVYVTDSGKKKVSNGLKNRREYERQICLGNKQ